MAGSYNHAITDEGKLRNWQTMTLAIDDGGDAYETIEEMFGMIWWLAEGNPVAVEAARRNYQEGIGRSPGVQDEDEVEDET